MCGKIQNCQGRKFAYCYRSYHFNSPIKIRGFKLVLKRFPPVLVSSPKKCAPKHDAQISHDPQISTPSGKMYLPGKKDNAARYAAHGRWVVVVKSVRELANPPTEDVDIQRIDSLYYARPGLV